MKELHRRGRPKLNEDVAKSQIIQVRITTKETKLIDDHCLHNNISVSTLLRECINRFINE